MFHGIGSGVVHLLRATRVARLTASMSRLLSRIVPEGPRISGFSNLYRQFTFKTWAGNIRVSSGGTYGVVTGALKHIVHDLLKKSGSAGKQELAEMLALKELEAAINFASMQGIKTGQKIWVRTSFAEWELIFESAKGSDETVY